ncbi:hypothetical protein T4D_4647 [Trichinella pseudospiralis]|uniref:Uncharacterized protein n=1 Tax=Trichinella pseudospiralis TaxID=6337 RepID=A0A0V1F2S5_TRIPS|nr:hypothetical protein T4D_4647 [Trichinella pseudospiralis]
MITLTSYSHLTEPVPSTKNDYNSDLDLTLEYM